MEIQNIDSPQALGIVILILLSKRESTSVLYQYKEWGFDDIPESIINQIDQLKEGDQFKTIWELIAAIAC